MKYPMLAARIFDTPLLIAQPKMRAILAALGDRMGFALREPVSVPVRVFSDYEEPDAEAEGGGYTSSLYCVENGVARIPIIGTLVHRAGGIEAMSGLTSYLALSDAFACALADDNAKSILFEIDSPGGEANGAFDFADEIFAARGQKPIVAIAKDWACSGAYLIGAAADRVVVTQTGEIGSIGVVWCHVDYSVQNKMLGEAVTYLFAGDHKIDGTPDKPLNEAMRTRFQGEVDKLYELFVGKIARYRGLSAENVRATQALTYSGNDGVTIGLADEVSTLRDVLESLAIAGATPVLVAQTPDPSALAAQTPENHMTTKVAAPAEAAQPNPPTPNPPNPPAQPQPSPNPPAPTPPAPHASASEERMRIAAILDCEEAKGRGDLARHIAFSTAMPVDEARAMLAKAEVKAAADTKAPNALEAAMNGVKNPAVGADANGGDGDEAATLARAIVTSHRGVNPTQQRSN